MASEEKTVFDVLAPIVGLSPYNVERRCVEFDESVMAAMEEAAQKTPTPVATLRALFNAAARESAARRAQELKASIAALEDKDF